MTLCIQCGACEECCLCTQPEFRTDDTIGLGCRNCMLLERKEIERQAARQEQDNGA